MFWFMLIFSQLILRSNVSEVLVSTKNESSSPIIPCVVLDEDDDDKKEIKA